MTARARNPAQAPATRAAHRATRTNAPATTPPPKRGATLADVREHFAALQVAKFKWPERVEHLAEIPRTLVGKVDKKRLVDGLT